MCRRIQLIVLRASVSRASISTEDGFYVVSVWIEYKSGVVLWRRLIFAWPRRPVVCSASLQSGCMEGINLDPALGHEGRMLFYRMRMEAIYPKDRVFHAVADPICSLILGKLHDAAESQRAQGGIIEGGGVSNVSTPMPV